MPNLTVEPLHKAQTCPAWRYFEPMARMAALISEYSPQDLALLINFMHRSNPILHEAKVRPSGGTADGPPEHLLWSGA